MYGCRLLSTDYKRTTDKLRYVCKCGESSITTFNRFIKAKRCIKCSRESAGTGKRIPYAEVKEYFRSQGCRLLSDTYTRNSSKLRYICECGTEAEITFANFKQGKRCRDCLSAKLRASNLLTYEFVKSVFESEGCVLLSKEYSGNKSSLTFICNCGREATTVFDRFQRGARCWACRNDNLRGANNPWWNPELSDEERVLNRDYYAYDKWRETVYERDNYTCQKCGARGGTINAHHKDGYSWCEARRLDLDNGVTLCSDCHKEFHTRYGNRQNTEAEYNEWISREDARMLIASI